MENGDKKEKQESPERDHFKEILAYIEKTDLEFVQIEKDGRKVSLKRSSASIPASKVPQASQETKEDTGPRFSSIRSPIVGRFRSSMGADRPALVVEGGVVTAGQRVAVVEAMKIKKEVFSPLTGRVVKILVKDGDAVEYGQELFSVEPEKREE